jgi:DNA-binding NarL/FixJ family response regulator
MSETSEGSTLLGIVLSDDLMFTSRITGTARDLGLTIKPARSIEILKEGIVRDHPTCLIVDLSFPGFEAAAFLKWLRETGAVQPRVVAYGSHVDAATLRLAREAGCEAVMPRSQFVIDLPNKLRGWMGAEV